MKKTEGHISIIRELKNNTQTFFLSPIRQLRVLCALCALCSLSFFCVSCEVETHSHGNIDGNWHLVKIDTLATEGSMDLNDSRIFWGFQANLVQLCDNDRPDTVYIMRFAKDDNTLILCDPHINDRETGDPIAELTPTFCHFGVNKKEETFTIEQLKSTRMTILSDMLRLTFKKH